MKPELQRFTSRYSTALKSYLEGQGEEALLRAYETGREAVAARLGVLEMSAVHQVALVQVLLERLPAEESQRLARLATDFSAESLVPFELTVRGTREANAMLQQLNETLESKNAEIRRQLEELRSLQSLKDDLMSLIVHDLRNPLMGILSCLDLMKSGSGGAADETREVVGLAVEGTRKLSELIDDILEVRQLETGKLVLRVEPANLAELVKEAIATLDAAAMLAEVRFELLSGTEKISIELDRKLLRRSIENLLSNALKFSPPGSAVEVKVLATDSAVSVEVADRGPGIATEVKDQLFQKFGSLEAESVGSRRGHGLGLYFVKLVATAHGGSVSVREREGGGSVFTLTLRSA